MSAGLSIAKNTLACAAVLLLTACGQSVDSTATSDPAAA